MMSDRQSGFSLVELMIALVIGLLITLGAGQLFLIGLQNFRQVELLGNKQAALTFAAEMMIRDIRRADDSSITWDTSSDPKALVLEFTAASSADGCTTIGGTVERIYSISDSAVSDSEGWSLMLDQNCPDKDGSPEPLVTGFGPDGLLVEAKDGDASDGDGQGIYSITFCLISEPGDVDCNLEAEGVEFHAVNRTAAITG